MHRQSCPGIMRLLGVVFAVTTLIPPSAFGQPQPLRATVVNIKGAAETWHVTDKDGKIVEVQVPSQSIIDIQISKEERPGASGTSGQGTGTVLATVVAVDTLTNRVKVQTQAGQVIELETSTKDRQIGEQVTLIVPR
jgi:diaminopimelate epimerase